MQSGYIERVLTFNFDSILSRACNMLGLHPSIYDFATANPHLYHLINDPSIVHLHGQGTGFVQLNTGEETEKHTAQLGEFIAATLNSNPSLFIGYSGNADAFFPLLEEKYSEQHRLIWTGTKNNIDNIESDSVKKFLKKNNNLTHYIGNIYADDFLIQLAKELDCFPPELFLNPYNFLNKQLEFIQPYPLGDGLDVLANLSGYLKEQSNKPLIKSLYTSFIHKYPSKESTSALSEKAINDVMWAYDQQAGYLSRQKKFEESFKIYQQALMILPTHYGCSHNYALSLSEFAVQNQNEKKFEEAIQQFEKTLKIQTKNANSMFSYANTLLQYAYFKQEEHVYLKAFNYYELSLSIQPDNSKFIFNYAVAQGKLAQLTQDKNLFLKAIDNYEKTLNIKSDELEVLNSFCWALIFLTKLAPNKAYANRAIELLEKSLLIKPDDPNTLEIFSSALLTFLRVFNDDIYLSKAHNTLQRLIIASPNKTYNLSCYYSIMNNVELTKENLLHAEQHNTLPSNPYKHLNEDKDLDNVRTEQWFIDLLERLKEKEQNDETA